MVRNQIKRVSYKALLARQFPRLLPLQVLLLAISAVNGVISSYYGSNFVNMEAMSAIGLFMPISMDPAAGIGIRLVFHLAREVQYQSILGLNVLTMYLPERSENGIDGDQGK
ncbi:MAG TPA: hypothetical protein DHV42_06600 [Lachnospiraceae bacterium]|nr:hypothetical protein [Lachnospiraceae bacterium]